MSGVGRLYAIHGECTDDIVLVRSIGERTDVSRVTIAVLIGILSFAAIAATAIR